MVVCGKFGPAIRFISLRCMLTPIGFIKFKTVQIAKKANAVPAITNQQTSFFKTAFCSKLTNWQIDFLKILHN